LQKRYLPVAIVTGILALLALVGYMLPEQQGKVPRRILMENTGGAVVFQHAAHADKLKIPCETCHHESPEARDDVRPCKSCHGVVFDAAFKKDHVTAITDNASCVTCHHYELKRKKWGHDRHHQEIGVDCRFCHHENTDIEPSDIKHSGRGEYVPIADNSTTEGRALNRRVEIKIYTTLSTYE